MNAVIVSRHPAAIEFIRREAQLPSNVPVIEQATSDDVKGKIVYGNLPLHLAALADTVIAVEFSGSAPRGAEYSIKDMEAAGAVLRSYKITGAPACVPSGKPWRENIIPQGCAWPDEGQAHGGWIVGHVVWPSDCSSGYYIEYPL